jgi:hypothetical protein
VFLDSVPVLTCSPQVTANFPTWIRGGGRICNTQCVIKSPRRKWPARGSNGLRLCNPKTGTLTYRSKCAGWKLYYHRKQIKFDNMLGLWWRTSVQRFKAICQWTYKIFEVVYSQRCVQTMSSILFIVIPFRSAK